MINNKKGNSIIEVIVVIVVLTVWIIWAYGVLNSWQNLAITTENRIKAINIAREWIEAVENIRDTNWIIFSNDYINCWKILKYNPTCIWVTPLDTEIMSWSYVLINNWLWTLSWVTSPWLAPFNIYRQAYPVYLDSDWLITQSWSDTQICNSSMNSNCVTIFSREIIIQTDSTTSKKIKVNSIVRWIDKTEKAPNEINLETNFTNWKSSF
jgi:hypothetical protein